VTHQDALAALGSVLERFEVDCDPDGNSLHSTCDHEEQQAGMFLAALAIEGYGLYRDKDVAALREALLHLSARRHEHSDGCDGCLNVQAMTRTALEETDHA
jgi:hypothetical protein